MTSRDREAGRKDLRETIRPVSNEADQTGLAVYNADEKDLTVVLRMGERVIYKTIPM